MKYNAAATCAFGLEAVTAFELRRLGAENVNVTDGRILFSTDAAGIAKANIRLRTAERVLLLLSEFPAATFDELFDGVKNVPWGEFIGRTDAFPVKGYSMSSLLTSVPACQSIVKKAVVERMKQDYGTQFLTEKSGVTVRVRFSIIKDRCTVMLDTSGDGLHKRGYRPLLNEAPIKETLAAGIADLARVKKDSLVADPFCGSGTLVIESALRALNIAPGLNRGFAAEEYGFIGKSVFDNERLSAKSEIDTSAAFEARGLDIDPKAIETAKADARRAGVGDRITFETADARRFVPKENEIILANPPYGERLMSPEEVKTLYADFGAALKGKKCGGLYVISGYPEFEKAFGEKASRRRKLYNGMLPCQLYMYF